MPQILFNRAYLILFVFPLMSLHSGNKHPSQLEIIQRENDELRKEILAKQVKRKVIEDQINYHDSIKSTTWSQSK